MNRDQAVATWVVMIQYFIKKACGLTTEQFLELDCKYSILDFLIENYELLHYYDNDYIVDDTIKYVSESGGASNELFRSG